MKLNSNKLIAIVCIYLIVLSCSEHIDLAALESDMITIQIKSPDGNFPQTRACLQGNSTSNALKTMWNEGEAVHVFALQNEKLVDLGEWPLTGVPEDGSTANIAVRVSGRIDITKPYDLFGASSNMNIQMYNNKSVSCTFKSPTRSNWTPWTCSYIHIPWYFKAKGGNKSFTAQAYHLVAYEFTHITNKTKNPLLVNLKGYNAPKKWYYNKVNLTLPDCKVTGSNDGDIAESGGYEIDIDDTQAYFTCYLPNGEKPQGLQMNIAIDKKNEYKSSNLCNSNTLMQVGHAYHIRGVWDGEKLIFRKEIEEDNTGFELDDIPGEDIVGPSNENPTGKDIETFTVNGVSFNMVRVEGGTFMMGANDDEEEAMPTEKPKHQVTLSSFYIGMYEVTQEVWQVIMGNNPSYYVGTKRPVELVSWNECHTFISKLNNLTGTNFRLPTEAEWEFAARGGRKGLGYKYSGSDNMESVAWCNSNSSGESHEVGLKKPNELGLYDMSGNVEEWCQDMNGNYSENNQTNPTGPPSPEYGVVRVLRGGSYWSSYWYNGNWRWPYRVSARSGLSQWSGDSHVGLRLVLETSSEGSEPLPAPPD